jgi:hypothetical protein
MPSPSNAELIAAVRAFLEKDVAPQLQGRQAYHAKVAAHLLAQVERALTLPPVPDVAVETSAAIRDCSADETTPGLLGTLRAATLAQLGIDNPKYSTFVRLTSHM